MVSDRVKARYDRAANTENFYVVQLVLFYNPTRKKGSFPNMQSSWEGLHKVSKRLNDVMYRIQKAGSPRTKMKVIHKERLEIYGSRYNEPIRDEQA